MERLTIFVTIVAIFIAPSVVEAVWEDVFLADGVAQVVRRGDISATASATAATPPAAASGSYNRSLNATGWNVLKIVTSAAYSDHDQAYAAGFYEGHATSEDIERFYHIYQESFVAMNASITESINNYFSEHLAWIDQQVVSEGNTSDRWRHMSLILQQLRGLRDGFNSKRQLHNASKWSTVDLLYLVALGDLWDLQSYFSSEASRDWSNVPRDEFLGWLVGRSRCSALIKVADDLSDIFFGHTTWSTYKTMLRIYKHYTLNFNSVPMASTTMSMSSYPGMLTSLDDFYVNEGSELAVMETSLEVYNKSMYAGNILPQSLLYWERALLANRAANSSKEWSAIFGEMNSGTYNNQWMVLDLKKFTPNQPLPPDTLWVLEQMPGMIATRDVTDYLRYGYYPSYNVPMNEELYDRAGYPAVLAAQGPQMLSYQSCVRANIFRRDQAKVDSLDTFKLLMAYNDYENDPLSYDEPAFAVSARVDLQVNPAHRQCVGGIDSKVSSVVRWKGTKSVEATSGPTLQQPVFEFSGASWMTNRSSCGPHVGLPSVFNFGYQSMSP